MHAQANPEPSQDWHSQTVEAVIANFDTSPEGLTVAEAQKRYEQYGANHLPEPPRQGRLKRFLLQFHNVLIYVLLGSAMITAFLQHLTDTLVILAVVIVNALIGFVQEGKAEKAMDAIRQMLAPMASVVRHGERHVIKAETLVPGDLVFLDTGDKVPADLRVIHTHGLMIQESILTGESVAVEKSIRPVAKDTVLGDRNCMAYSGTLVTGGQGKGIVVATGTSTEVGRIGSMLTEVQTLSTPLVTQMSAFAKW